MENIVQGTDPNLTLVCLAADEASAQLLRNSLSRLEGFSVYLLRVDASDVKFMFEQASKLLTELDKVGFKRSTLVAFGRASSIAQIALSQNAQIVRRAVLVNPETREKPSWWASLKEASQKRWKLPLPFRLSSEKFDLRYLAHRVACPLLLVQGPGEEKFLKDSALELSVRAPSAYLLEGDFASLLPNGSWQLSEWFVKLCREFIEIPAKRSQKNLSGKTKTGDKAPLADLQCAA